MRSHQIAKHNSHSRLQQHTLKKTIFFTAQKGKSSRGQKSIHITKFLVPGFYKYCRNEITTLYQQCCCQTKQSERALAKNGGTIKWTKLLHIKSDILKLQFCIYLWKKIHICPAAFNSLFRMRPI